MGKKPGYFINLGWSAAYCCHRSERGMMKSDVKDKKSKMQLLWDTYNQTLWATLGWWKACGTRHNIHVPSVNASVIFTPLSVAFYLVNELLLLGAFNILNSQRSMWNHRSENLHSSPSFSEKIFEISSFKKKPASFSTSGNVTGWIKGCVSVPTKSQTKMTPLSNSQSSMVVQALHFGDNLI